MPYLGLAPTTGENNSFRILDDISSYTLTFDGSSSSVVSNSDETITENNHRFVQGQRVTYTNGGGANIGGLTTGSVYYIIRDDKNTIRLAETSTKAAALDAINLTVANSGSSHTLTVAFDGVNTKFKATYDDGTIVNMTRAAQLVISINGVLQQPHDTSSPSSGFGYEIPSVIVLSTAPQAAFEFWGNIIASNNPTYDIADNKVDTFVGNGSATEFTLSKNSVNNENLIVTLDGVIQYPTIGNTTRAYNAQDNVLTFTTAPGNGVDIQVRHIGFAGNVVGGGGGVTGFYGRTGNVSLLKTDLQNQDITLRNLTGVAATFTGNVSIGGTLTYQDVTNIDSVGIITANTSIHVGADVAHLDDDHTKLAFTENQIDLQTNGYSRVYVNDSGVFVRSGTNLALLAATGPSPAIKSGGTNNQDLLLTTGTNNPTRVVIDVDGKVGINTSNPSTIFVVSNDGHEGLEVHHASGVVEANAYNRSGSARSPFEITAKTFKMSTGNPSLNVGLCQDLAGKVGIGITTPATKVQIHGGDETLLITGDTAVGSAANTGGTLALGGIYHTDGSITGWAQIKGFKDNNSSNNYNGYLSFTTRDTTDGYVERLRITSAGKLQVKGTRGGDLQPEDDDTLQLYTKSTDNSINRGSGITFYNHDGSGYEMGGTIQVAKVNGNADDEAAYMRFSTRPAGSAAQERLRISSVGHLGVGDNNPDTRLSVKAISGTDVVGKFTSTDAKAWIQFRDNSTTDTGVMIGAEGDALMLRSGSNERVRIHSDGQVTIGNDHTGAGSWDGDLVVANTTGGRITVGDTGSGEKFSIAANGDINLYSYLNDDNINFHTTTGDSTQRRLRIAGDGQVQVSAANTGTHFDVGSGDNLATMTICDTTEPSAIGVGGKIIFASKYYNASNRMAGAYIGQYKIAAPSNGVDEYRHALTFGSRNENDGLVERMRITHQGKVGIGTVAPDETLELFKPSGTNLVKVSTEANSTIGIELEKTGATTQSWRIVDGQTVNGALEFYDVTDSRRVMGIDGSGRVIIGSGNDTSEVTLVAKGNTTSSTSFSVIDLRRGEAADAVDDVLGYIRFSDSNITSSNQNYAHIHAAVDGASTNASDNPGRLVFSTTADGDPGPTERLRITATGAWAIEGASNYGTSGQVLTSNGNDSPTWQAAGGGGSTDLLEIMLFT